MRLIDADKLLKQLDDDINITSEFVKKSIKYDDYHDFDKSFAILYMLKGYRAIVEDMPTAFDVKKVISELKEEKMWYKIHGINKDIKRGIIGATRKAIEIVKKGGKDE